MKINGLTEKYNQLSDILATGDGVVVAFSGGVDSALLMKAAFDACGNNALAVTIASEFFPSWELDFAVKMAKDFGFRHIVKQVTLLDIPLLADNPENRCYICKKNIISVLKQTATEYFPGKNNVIIAEGTNSDDLTDHRPGYQAVCEGGLVSPFVQIGLGKDDIRNLSREMKIPGWDRSACSCLATRFPHGCTLEADALKAVDIAEHNLREAGYSLVRVRAHGKAARIEVPVDDFPDILQKRIDIIEAVKNAGFSFVSLDLSGYKMGNMNNNL